MEHAAMRVAVIGSRTYRNYKIVKEKLDKLHSMRPITCIVSGGANGADSLGERWADENSVPKIVHEANWDDLSHPDALIKTNSRGKRYDARAGFRRNEMIVGDAQLILAFWDNVSRGTRNTLEIAERLNKPYKTFLF